MHTSVPVNRYPDLHQMNSIIRTAAFLGALAVVLGAFGAHALRQVLSEKGLALWETAVRYHFYHALALLCLGVVCQRVSEPRILVSYRFFLAGFILFCGSLYALAFRDVSGFNLSWLGPITPLGGLCFVVAWLLIAFNSRASSHQD